MLSRLTRWMRPGMMQTTPKYIGCGMALAGLAILCSEEIYAQCYSNQDACSQSVPVPCDQASCVSISYYPEGEGLPLCDALSDTPTRYSSTIAPSWSICWFPVEPTGIWCNENSRVCANVYIYKNATQAGECTTANRCSTTTWNSCSPGQIITCP